MVETGDPPAGLAVLVTEEIKQSVRISHKVGAGPSKRYAPKVPDYFAIDSHGWQRQYWSRVGWSVYISS